MRQPLQWLMGLTQLGVGSSLVERRSWIGEQAGNHLSRQGGFQEEGASGQGEKNDYARRRLGLGAGRRLRTGNASIPCPSPQRRRGKEGSRASIRRRVWERVSDSLQGALQTRRDRTPGPRPARRCWEPVGGRSEASLPRGSGSELEGEGNEGKASREEPGGLRGSGVGGPAGRPGRADWENQPGRRRREQAALPARRGWSLSLLLTESADFPGTPATPGLRRPRMLARRQERTEKDRGQMPGPRPCPPPPAPASPLGSPWVARTSQGLR
ncbi:protein SPT2 homolog [Mustela nigripes]|uniref:protein SPT2 homolog n=1 Tax=Mustela nigripes TaxID=77151 RepID=UPI002816050F|nr:protein SPT2 homolog [Mustela nigripes]